MAGSNTKRSLSISVIVGTLLIPLSAVAAIWLTDPGAEAQAETTPDPTVTTTGPTTVQTTQTTTTTPISADLEMACGSEGLRLVDLEQARNISEVQQAALDALRGLCEQQGMPLPAPPAGEPVTRTVIVSTTAPREASSVTTASYEDHDDDYSDHEDDEEYEYEDDEDHEEYEHEDDEHHDDGHESEHERGDDD